MNQVRVRFGLRLGWPIVNAATFVLYMPSDRADELFARVSEVRQLLILSGRGDLASRLVAERS